MLHDDGPHHGGEHLGHGRVAEGSRPDQGRGDIMLELKLPLLAEELAADRLGRHRCWTWVGVGLYWGVL